MSGRLLLDENLSPRIARALATQFPGSVHVRDVELKGQSDHIIWNFAAKNGFTIATKDDDFRSLSLLQGPPTKGDLAGDWKHQHCSRFASPDCCSHYMPGIAAFPRR